MGNTAYLRTVSVPIAVHPHTSGEYSFQSSQSSLVIGSSPHKWGIQVLGVTEKLSVRFIPTQVGNTISSTAAMFLLSVHPHTSGEYMSTTINHEQFVGSSPHKWGIRLVEMKGHCVLRFIPTQVGNTQHTTSCCGEIAVHPHTSGEYEGKAYRVPTEAVHPHTSGEYKRIDGFLLLVLGSSPHKWGIPCGALGEWQGRRFIPTQVGNTL